MVVPSVYNYVSVFSSSGRLLWRYSIDTLPDITEISAPPAVGDVDGDGEYEVVFGTAGPSHSLYILSSDGTLKHRVPLPDVPVGPVVLGLFTKTSYPDIAVKVGDRVLFYDGDGNLINACGPYAWADEYLSAADLYGDPLWEVVAKGSSSGHEVVILRANCSDTVLTLPYPIYVGTRIYDPDDDGRWEVLLNAATNAYIFDPESWRMDSVPFPILPEADVTMPLEWDGTPGWEYARLNMYDLVVEDGDGSALLSHHDDIHPLGRRFVGGDVDGDGREEVFFSSGRSVLWGKTYYGDLLGFPMDLGHGDRFREEVVQGGPLLYDLDGDSLVELCAHTSGHHLYCWELGRYTRLSWPMVRGNRWNSGYGALEMPDTLIVSLREDRRSRSGGLKVSLYGRELRITGWSYGEIGVKIYNVEGRLIFGKTYRGTGKVEISVRLEELPAGAYFLTLATPEGRRLRKMILK